MGGRTKSICGDGFTFDLGPTFFLYPRILAEIFKSVGRDLNDEVEMLPLDPQYRLVFGAGGELVATQDVERMERAIAALCPDDAAAFGDGCTTTATSLSVRWRFSSGRFAAGAICCAGRCWKLLPHLRPWLSLDSELARYFRDPRVRLAFSFQSKYLGMSPFKCPSLLLDLSFMSTKMAFITRRAAALR